MQPVRRTLTSLVQVVSSLPQWVDAVFAGALCVATALTAMGAWHVDFSIPLMSDGDATATQYMIKTVLEHGWYTVNPDVGAPFGATMYDFPIPEPTNFGLVRILGLFGHNPFLVYNLFYLFSFASVGVAAWWGFRRLGTVRPMAIAGAFLFAMLLYHFVRLGHLFLASYFSAAIFATYATRLALYRLPHLSNDLRVSFGALLLLAIAAGAGVYYAFFGCLFIAAGGVMGWMGAGRKEPLLLAGAYTIIIAAVIALSLLPNALYHLAEGTNSLVAQRQSAEAEIYGLRITQLLLPPAGHRLHWFADLAARYSATAPLLNENRSATLGTLGSLGLLAAIGCCIFGDRSRLPMVTALGALALCGILFATIGGFGALFALLITPDIRGLNRISVFVAFFAIATTLTLAQRACGSRPVVCAVVALVTLIVGWYDEAPATRVTNYPDPAVFHAQQTFFRSIQSTLPLGSAVYELPYMFFPENPKTGSLASYDLFLPYLQTSGLRWSFGDMRGRPSDVWNQKVSVLMGAELVDALASAGFSAIYVNRAGYADRASAVEESIKPLLGLPSLEDPSHNLALYRIPAVASPALPFVVVTPGRGWYPWEKEAHHDPFGRARGSAELLVANPGVASHVVVQFTVISSTEGHLTVRNGKEQLGSYDLKAKAPVGIELNFVATAGISRIALDTNAEMAAGSFAFRLDNLAYGATARVGFPP